MTKDQIYYAIYEWENNAGESFTDYFFHDNVNDGSWAFWLLGKGYKEHANKIINQINADKGAKYFDQEFLYEVYPEHDENGNYLNHIHDLNMGLYAEFLAASDTYIERITKFLKREEE